MTRFICFCPGAPYERASMSSRRLHARPQEDTADSSGRPEAPTRRTRPQFNATCAAEENHEFLLREASKCRLA